MDGGINPPSKITTHQFHQRGRTRKHAPRGWARARAGQCGVWVRATPPAPRLACAARAHAHYPSLFLAPQLQVHGQLEDAHARRHRPEARGEKDLWRQETGRDHGHVVGAGAQDRPRPPAHRKVRRVASLSPPLTPCASRLSPLITFSIAPWACGGRVSSPPRLPCSHQVPRGRRGARPRQDGARRRD